MYRNRRVRLFNTAVKTSATEVNVMIRKLNSAENYAILREAEQAGFRPHFLLQICIFVILFILAQFVQSLAAVLFLLPSVTNLPENGNLLAEELMSGDAFMLAALFASVCVTLISLLYCRKIERRSYVSMGFSKNRAAAHYLSGLAAGAVLFSVTALICLVPGTVRFQSAGSISAGYLILFFIAYLIQGMSEEVLCRGYFMVSLAGKSSVAAAVIINSLMFSLLHFFNPNVTLLALFNIFLFGVFASVYTLVFDNIWGISALHSAWNFTQGIIFGSNVSGTSMQTRLAVMSPDERYSIINGGAFGPEGGIAMTAVYLLALSGLVYLLIRRMQRSTG